MGHFTPRKIIIILLIVIGFVFPTATHSIADTDLFLATSFSEEEIIINKSGFDDFNLTHDSEFIASTINSTHAVFTYDGDYPEEPIWERYMYYLPVNCSNFVVRVDVDYFTNETSGIFIDYLKVFGEDHQLSVVGVWDAWTASSAKFYGKTWPNGISDMQETDPNSAGTSGSVRMQMVRSRNVIETTIWDLSTEEIVFSYIWDDDGLSTLAYGYAITFRTGWLGAYTAATFYNMYATFNDSNSEPISSTPPTLTIGFNLSILSLSSILACIPIIIIRKKKS